MGAYPFSNFNPAISNFNPANPAGFNLPSYQPPQVEIPKVNGEESARAYQLAPNSSVILMDVNKPLIWVVVTDASGYKTVSPFTITPYTPDPPVTNADLDPRFEAITSRLDKLEARLNESNT